MKELPRHILREKQNNSTLTFYCSKSLKQEMEVKIEEMGISQSEYIKLSLKNLLHFIRMYEPYLLLVESSEMIHSSIVNDFSDEDHELIYRCVHNYRLLPSRSELFRFAIFLQKILDVIENPPEDISFDCEENMEDDEFLNDFFEFTISLEELRELYPRLPDFKYINEEMKKEKRRIK